MMKENEIVKEDDTEKILNYAESLIYHKIYHNMDDAMKESVRWYDKRDYGLEEPLKCPHKIGVNVDFIEVIDIHKTEYAIWTKEDWILHWIKQYGWIDGAHHKNWLLDQIVRILKGTKVIITMVTNSANEADKKLKFNLDEPTEEYKKFVEEYCNGEDGPNTYSYDEGTPP